MGNELIASAINLLQEKLLPQVNAPRKFLKGNLSVFSGISVVKKITKLAGVLSQGINYKVVLLKNINSQLFY